MNGTSVEEHCLMYVDKIDFKKISIKLLNLANLK